MKRLVITTIIIYLVTSINLSYSNSAVTSVLVSATVSATCKISANPLQFGTYDPSDVNAANNLSAVSKLSMNCVRGTTATIKIDSGMNQGRSTLTSRTMRANDGKSYLAYELYQDQGGQRAWDNQNPVIYHSNSIATANINIYASIPANQNVPDGIYSDVVNITAIY